MIQNFNNFQNAKETEKALEKLHTIDTATKVRSAISQDEVNEQEIEKGELNGVVLKNFYCSDTCPGFENHVGVALKKLTKQTISQDTNQPKVRGQQPEEQPSSS